MKDKIETCKGCGTRSDWNFTIENGWCSDCSEELKVEQSQEENS